MLKTASKIRYLPFFVFSTKIWCICRSVLWMNHSPLIDSIPSTCSVYILLTISSLIHWLSDTVIWTMRFHLERRLSSLLFESSNWSLRWHSSCTWSCVQRFRNHTIALHAHNCVSIRRVLPDIYPILCAIAQILHSLLSDSLHRIPSSVPVNIPVIISRVLHHWYTV